MSWHGAQGAGPDIEIHRKPVESDNPFLCGDLINQNEACWMVLNQKEAQIKLNQTRSDTATVKLRKPTRKRENNENSLNCFKSPARKRRPTSWIGVSLVTQTPKPYTRRADADSQPSLIGTKM